MKSKITAAVSAVLVLFTGAAAAVINTQTLSLGTGTAIDASKVASTSDIQVEQSAALTSNGSQTSLAEVVSPTLVIEPAPVVTVTVTPTPVPVVTSLIKPKVAITPQATSGGSSYSDDDKYEVEEEDDFDEEDDDDEDEGDDD